MRLWHPAPRQKPRQFFKPNQLNRLYLPSRQPWGKLPSHRKCSAQPQGQLHRDSGPSSWPHSDAYLQGLHVCILSPGALFLGLCIWGLLSRLSLDHMRHSYPSPSLLSSTGLRVHKTARAFCSGSWTVGTLTLTVSIPWEVQMEWRGPTPLSVFSSCLYYRSEWLRLNSFILAFLTDCCSAWQPSSLSNSAELLTKVWFMLVSCSPPLMNVTLNEINVTSLPEEGF